MTWFAGGGAAWYAPHAAGSLRVLIAVIKLILAVATSAVVIVFGRVLTGLFGSSYSPVQDVVADGTAPDDRATTFGRVSAAFAVGVIAAPVAASRARFSDGRGNDDRIGIDHRAAAVGQAGGFVTGPWAPIHFPGVAVVIAAPALR